MPYGHAKLSSQQIDTSRIIRPDYASPPYASLASVCQNFWRTNDNYHETGLCVTASGPEQRYVASSLRNIQALGTDRIEVLKSPKDIQRFCSLEANNPTSDSQGPGGGSIGYVNWSSGWADAEGAMRWMYREVASYNRVHFVTAAVTRLLISHSTNTVSGALLSSGKELTADLTILAAGAWSPALIDMRGICNATGQALAYLPLTADEQAMLSSNPTILNLSTGMFIITPSKGTLKVARHGHGYTNPTTIPHPEIPDENITISLPYTHVDANGANILPQEALSACRAFLGSIYPSLSTPERLWSKTRICWYADTPTHDFIIDYHPKYSGLFVATGGSGHAFKFLPLLGECVIECLMPGGERKWRRGFEEKWAWPRRRYDEGQWEGDGSRGGRKGMVLNEEMEMGKDKAEPKL